MESRKHSVEIYEEENNSSVAHQDEEESIQANVEEDWSHAIIEEDIPPLHEDAHDKPREEGGEHRGPNVEETGRRKWGDLVRGNTSYVTHKISSHSLLCKPYATPLQNPSRYGKDEIPSRTNGGLNWRTL
jgi:hypothetical protein